MSQNVELNLDDLSLELKDEDEDEEIDDDDDEPEEGDENDDDCQEDDYFKKCRTPMRKHPAIIQYWIDTGNPPHKLADELNNSGTGSSLSEEENSHCRTLIRNSDLKTTEKRANSPSPCTSVDTAAYILSNTNITKKSETIAIVEGAKNPVYSSLTVTVGSSREFPESVFSPPDISEPMEIAIIAENNNFCCDPTNLGTNTDKLADKSLNKCNEAIPQLKNGRVNNIATHKSVECVNNNSGPRSLRFSDVLPSLAQLDKLTPKKASINDSTQTGENPPIKLSPIKPNKLFARKKLYTGRDSPIDIIISTTNNVEQLSETSDIHPALLDSPIINEKQSYSKRRSNWLTRKKKQLSQVLEGEKSAENSPGKSIIDNQTINSVAQEQFFESIGLTPSTKSSRQSHLSSSVNVKNSAVINTTQNSNSDSNKISADTAKQPKETMNLNTKLADLKALVQLKTLVVSLTKIPTNFYSTVTKKTLVDERANCIKMQSNQLIPQSTGSSSPSQISDTVTNIDTAEIQEIDFDSQESDQSTIFLCECADETIESTLNRKNPELQSKTNLLKKSHLKNGKSKVSNCQDSISNIVSGNSNLIATSIGKDIGKNSAKKIKVLQSKLADNDKKNDVKKSVTFSTQSSSSSSDGSAKITKNNDSKSANELISLRKKSIFFVSDEEDDFVKSVQKNHVQCNDKKTSTHISTKTASGVTKNIETLPYMYDIVSSEDDDDDKCLNLTAIKNRSSRQQSSLSRMKKNKNKQKLKPITPTTMEPKKLNTVSSTSQLTKQTPRINSIAKVLKYRSDSSESEMSEESIISPCKKLKTESGAVPVLHSPDTIDDVSVTSPLNSSDSVPNVIDESIYLLNGNSSAAKRKVNKPSLQTSKPIENSRANTKELKILLEKITMVPKVLSTAKINTPIKNDLSSVKEERGDDNTTQSLRKKNVNTRKKRINETKNVSSRNTKRKVALIKLLVQSDSESSTDELQSSPLNKSDKSNKIKLNRSNKLNDTSNYKNMSGDSTNDETGRTTFFPNPLNDSTDNVHLLYTTLSYHNHHKGKRKSTVLNNKTISFCTRLNSDSDD